MNGMRQATLSERAATMPWFRSRVLAALAAGVWVLVVAAGAQAQQPTGPGQPAANPSGWAFNVAPYLWLPNINATFNYNLPDAIGGRLPTDASVGPGEILSRLNFATMVAADAQYGRLSLLTDFVYLNVSNTTSHFRSVETTGQRSLPIANSEQFGTGTRLNAAIWALAGGYTAVQGDWGNLDVLAGFRYLHVGSNTNFDLGLTLAGPRGNGATFGRTGTVSASGDIWNGIAGFRGRIRLKDTGLFIPYYFDIGAGGSNLTWQIASGLGYQAGWAGVSVTYRYLSFEQGSGAVVKHLALGGPMVMVNFSF